MLKEWDVLGWEVQDTDKGKLGPHKDNRSMVPPALFLHWGEEAEKPLPCLKSFLGGWDGVSTGLRCHRSSAGSFLLHPGTWARTEVMSALLKHLSRRRYLALKILWHLSMRCTPRQRELSSRSRRALSSFWPLNIIHLSSYEVIHIQILLDAEDLFISSVYSAHRELVLWLILFLCFLCFNNDLPSSIWLWIDGGERDEAE